MTISSCAPFRNFLLILLLPASLPAIPAPLYKWVDAQGQTHYSDQPPADAPTEDISGHLAPLNIGDTEATNRQLQAVFPEPTEQEKAFEQQQAERRAEQRKQHELQCAAARRQLEIMRGPVIFVDAQGNSEAVSDAERQQRADQLAADIRRNCY